MITANNDDDMKIMTTIMMMIITIMFIIMVIIMMITTIMFDNDNDDNNRDDDADDDDADDDDDDDDDDQLTFSLHQATSWFQRNDLSSLSGHAKQYYDQLLVEFSKFRLRVCRFHLRVTGLQTSCCDLTG